MARTTIDFGIDLGTTNSAVAVINGVAPEIVKNNRDEDVTPSAVSISKKGEIHVGWPAKNKLVSPQADDVATEFKRAMGTDHIYSFRNGESRKPEELSAEILKTLAGDVQGKKGETIEAVVVTVPAAFELHQCDATRRAAELAGFQQSSLLLEPVAAALAYGFQLETQRSYWLVFDFGGGTFDAALIKGEDGTIQVVNHGGDNYLGGSDIDWALVEKIIAPRMAKDYALKDFNRANAMKGGRWRQAFMRLKFAAEEAKVELSRKERVSLDVSYASNIKDESTGAIVIEEVELEITRNELIRIAEPFIARSASIAKRVLTEKRLASAAIERLILVGGPTIAPYFREALIAELGIQLDFSVDPLTVVARGAAIFSATQKVTVKRKTPDRGVFVVDIHHKPVAPETDPVLGGKVSGSDSATFSGWTIEFVNPRSLWRSGKLPIRDDGFFRTSLHVEKGYRNAFVIELNDPSGRKQKTDPEQITYTVGAVADEQPLIHSIGIALANNAYERFFEKGQGLPQKATRVLKTVEAVRQGYSGDLIKVPIIEGDNDLADRNRRVGELSITGTNIQRDLPVGSDIEVTLDIDAQHTITLTVYIPLLDVDLPPHRISLQKVEPDPSFLRADFEAEMKRLHDAEQKAATAKGQTAAKVISEIQHSADLAELQEALPTLAIGGEVTGRFEARLLEWKLKLDQAADAVEWPALVVEARQWLNDLQSIAKDRGTDKQRKRTADLATELNSAVAEDHSDKLRRVSSNIQTVYFEILLAQPEFWVSTFNNLEGRKSQMKDSARATRLFEHGRDCLAKNNKIGIQNVVRELWALLPQEIAEETRRGYGAGLVR